MNMNMTLEPVVSLEKLKQITPVLLTAQGPLGLAEMADLTGCSIAEIKQASEGYGSTYEWLVIFLTRHHLKIAEEQHQHTQTLGEVNRNLYTSPGREIFLTLVGLVARIKTLPISENPIAVGSALGEELLRQKHVGKFLQGTPKEEALSELTKHLAMTAFVLNGAYWEGLLGTLDGLNFNVEDLVAHLTDGA